MNTKATKADTIRKNIVDHIAKINGLGDCTYKLYNHDPVKDCKKFQVKDWDKTSKMNTSSCVLSKYYYAIQWYRIW
jgi:hypothetical protein